MLTLLLLGHLLTYHWSSRAVLNANCGTPLPNVTPYIGCYVKDVKGDYDVYMDEWYKGKPGGAYTMKHETAHIFCEITGTKDEVHQGKWPKGFLEVENIRIFLSQN